MRFNVHTARAIAPPVMTGRHYRSADIRTDIEPPMGFHCGQHVFIRWCSQDRRGRDVYAVSSTNSFSGYTRTFCARVLENFSIQE